MLTPNQYNRLCRYNAKLKRLKRHRASIEAIEEARPHTKAELDLLDRIAHDILWLMSRVDHILEKAQ